MQLEAPARQGMTVSIVIHRSDPQQLDATLATLLRAAAQAALRLRIKLVDNADGPLPAMLPPGLQLHHGHGNVGFGAGHNRTLDGSDGELHLILNPDVELAAEALVEALAFLDRHPDCGLLVPWVVNANGTPEFLCKRYPTVLDLLLRGFAPDWLRCRFARRLGQYELRDQAADAVLWDPPIVSGCFMLFRTEVLKALGGFDPRYFLYFEDFDLSLRAARLTRVARVPAVRIVHHGGHAARKGWRHIRMFVRSGTTFFNTHGWKLW